MTTGKKRAIYSLLLCAVGVGIAGLQYSLTPRCYSIETAKITAGKELRLVMLSDLHSWTYGENQSRLLYHIRQQQPDGIMLCGDMVDDKYPRIGAEQLLSQLPDIAPCYYVSGNHEFWSGEADEIFAGIASYGISVLRSSWEPFTIKGVTIHICGVDDPAVTGNCRARSYGDRTAYLKQLDTFDVLLDDVFTILLAHRPEYIMDYAKHTFDLTLCGHAHGGQWRIPFLMNGLIAPNQGWFPKYAGGMYFCGGMTEIVGRGLLCDWKPRLFNPPEIVIIDIKGTGHDV